MTLEEKKAELGAVMEALPIIDKLPPGLQEWAMQYIDMLQSDIAAQDQARDSPKEVKFNWLPILQIVGEVAIAAIKKHWPTASISAGASALVSFVFNYFQK